MTTSDHDGGGAAGRDGEIRGIAHHVDISLLDMTTISCIRTNKRSGHSLVIVIIWSQFDLKGLLALVG